MAIRAKRLCSHPGCNELVTSGRCERHTKITQQEADQRRGSSNDRGYNWRWRQYSKAFIAKPQNALCKLKLDDGCAIVSQCVDHIDPPNGPNDPRFWDKTNHQGACIHCNSVKGKRNIMGKAHVYEG